MARQTYEDFFRTVRPEQLGANGRFRGPSSGTAYYAEGMTPQEFYNAHINDQRDTGRFTGSGDNMTAEMESAGPVSADWTEGPTGNRGLFGGVSDMMTNPKTLMGLLAMGGIGALGNTLAGSGFSGMSGAGSTVGSAGAAGDFGLNATLASGGGDIAALTGNQIAALSPAASGSGFSFAVPEAMNGAVGLDLGGVATTAIPGESAMGAASLLGNESAAETARLASMNAGTNTLGGISPGSAIGNSSMLDTAVQWIKDNPTLARLGGTALGALGGAAANGDRTTSRSESRDPWAPAQPYLIDNLKTNANAQEYYRANPFSDLQKQQYQNAFNSMANSQANIPGLLANGNNFMQSRRGVMPAMNGLLSGTQAPTINWSEYANIGRRG